MPEALEVFASYVQVWSFGQMVQWWNDSQLLDEGSMIDMIQILFVVASFFQPKRKIIPGIAFMMRILNILIRAPRVSAPDYISLLTDLPAMLCIFLRHPHKTTLLPSRAIRWQLALLYMSSAFWKMNATYIHARYSCASIQALQFIDAFALSQVSSLAAPIALAIVPWLSIFLEFAVGISILISEPAAAALLAIGLHALGSLTPPPNNSGTLGVTCATRFFWIAPFAMTRAWRNAVEYAEFAVHASVGAIFLAITVRKHPALTSYENHISAARMTNSSPSKSIYHTNIVPTAYATVDWAAGAFGVLASLVARAALLHQRPDTRDAAIKKREGIVTIVAESSSPGVSCLALILAALYGIFAVSFGILDIGSNTLNSGLRLYGGSNHFLAVPTGILQNAYYSQPSSLFSGGVLRIEHSTSILLNQLHPAEVTPILAPGARRLLSEHRHVARLWNSAHAIVQGNRAVLPPSKYIPSSQFSTKAEHQEHALYTKNRRRTPSLPEPIPFPKYTLPAYELTRVLNAARRQLSQSSSMQSNFRIVYARLDGVSGDEQWRRHSVTKLIQLDVDATGTNCTVLDTIYDEFQEESHPTSSKHATSTSKKNLDQNIAAKSTHSPTHPPEAHHPEAAACAPEDFLDGRAWSTSLLNLIGRKFLASHSYPVVPRLTLSRYERHADELSCYGA